MRRIFATFFLTILMLGLAVSSPFAATEEAKRQYMEAIKATMQTDKSIREEDRAKLDELKQQLQLTDDEAQAIEARVKME